MATVRPFRGTTYDPTRVPDLGEVTCPPYDVISDDDRVRLYGRHPYNVVRIVSGREEPDDSPDDNRYTRACAFFRSWTREGVLREDADPAVYVYRQAFTDPRGAARRVWGVLATISLDDEILAHEKTMSGPKQDRLALMEAVPANLSPIYALCREDGGGISHSLPERTDEPPVTDFVDDQSTRHTVWPVHDDAFHQKVAAAMAPAPLLIADGHHRFETSRVYRDRRRAADGPGAWDHTMALLVDPGAQPVCILPYHRVVRRMDVDDVVAVLEKTFEIVDSGPLSGADPAALEAELWDAEAGSFVCFTPTRVLQLVARDDVGGDVPAGVLKRLALDPLGATSAEEHLTFTPSATVVRDEVASERARAGFLIPTVDVQRVWDLAQRDGAMPEKSTYFYPKPRDGIVMRAFESCG